MAPNKEVGKKPVEKAQTRRVRFRAAGADEVETGKIAAFSLTGNDPALSRLGPEPWPGVEALVLPRNATLMCFHLASQPQRKQLLVDVSEMAKTGTYQTIRTVQGKRWPTVFYIEGANIYTCEEGNKIEVQHSKDGFRVALDRCKMVPANLDLEEKTLARGKDKPGTITVSMSMDAPVAPRARTVTTAKVSSKLEAIGRGRGKVAAEQPAVASRAADPLYCAWLLWQIARALQEARACLAQWWNPFAIWAGWSKLALAAHYTYLHARHCR